MKTLVRISNISEKLFNKKRKNIDNLFLFVLAHLILTVIPFNTFKRVSRLKKEKKTLGLKKFMGK